MTTYRVKLYAETDEDVTMWMELYLDVEIITGFYIPLSDEDEEPSINIFIGDAPINIKQEDHIIDYLYNRFAKNAVKND